MKFKGVFRAPQVNFTKWKQQLEEELSTELARSAGEWLATAVAAIPVWSGAARATLIDLGNLINFHVQVSPKSTAPDRRGIGKREGRGELIIDSNKGQFEFSYSTTLDHLIFNETQSNQKADPNIFKGLLTPIPYKFLEKSRRVWEAAVQSVRLPAPVIKAGQSIRF